MIEMIIDDDVNIQNAPIHHLLILAWSEKVIPASDHHPLA